MNIFELRQQLIDDFAEYVKSLITIRDPQISNYVGRELFQDGVLCSEPLIPLNPRFASGKSIDALVDESTFHETPLRDTGGGYGIHTHTGDLSSVSITHQYPC